MRDIPNGRYYYFSNAKSIKLNLSIPYKEILLEAKALRDKFIPYRTDESYIHKGWYTLPLHALGDDKPYSWVNYSEYKSGREASPYYNWTSFSKDCPVTVNWLQTVYPSKCYGRVRFMLLEAGGYISPHNDCEHYVINPINIALSNHKNCIWKWGDNKILNFDPGDVRGMNVSHMHSVENNSSEDRYHMILYHHDSTSEYLKLMNKSFKENNESYTLRYSTILS